MNFHSIYCLFDFPIYFNIHIIKFLGLIQLTRSILEISNYYVILDSVATPI